MKKDMKKEIYWKILKSIKKSELGKDKEKNNKIPKDSYGILWNLKESYGI